MEYIIYLILLLFTGALVGFASGLLGVGGGFIMVPVQFLLLTSIGIDSTIAIRVAFGTSLAVILPTAVSGALGHKRRGKVLTRPLMLMGSTAIIASFIGGTLASHLPGSFLTTSFGVLVLISAVWMLTADYSNINTVPKKGVLNYLIIGFIAGMLSGLLGIGGGMVLIPILVLLMGFNIRYAVGTSTAVIIFTATGGIVAYLLNGFNITGLPPYSVGYINLIQLVVLAGASILTAQLGVKASHRLPEKQLRYVFIVVTIYIGLKMIGVFTWLGLPL